MVQEKGRGPWEVGRKEIVKKRYGKRGIFREDGHEQSMYRIPQ